MGIVDVIAIVCLVVAMALLAIALWNAVAWPSVREDAVAVVRSIAILIPARDEERNLPACLDAATAQGSVVREILVYDDHSTDRTPGIVAEYAERDERVRLVPAEPLPPGWCGKNFACATLASSAASDWLLFLDADARLARDAAPRLLAEAQSRGVTLLSPWPALLAETAGERLLMPMLDVVVFTLFPAPLSLERDDVSLGLVHGACILAERGAYGRVGGHGAVRGEIFEDQRIARLWRERGERGACLAGGDVVAVRMYRSVGELWRGFQKNFHPAFRHRASFWLFLSLHGIALVLPFVLWPVSAVAGAAALAIVAMRIALAVRFRHALWSALLHPVAGLFVLLLGLSSWWRCRSGRGVVWKGRTYDASRGPAVAGGGAE